MARQATTDLRRILPLALVLLVAAAIYYIPKHLNKPANVPSAPPAGPGEYLLCSWNVENLFDDQHDKRNPVDAEYDQWFAEKPEDLQLKLKHLAEALVKMNGGRGPDILVAIEVESKRAAELLAEALNKALPEGAAKYTTVVMKEISAGRHIAPAIISRLPLGDHEPRVLSPQRILIADLTAGGHDLTIFATHWTSHRSDEEGGKRDKYADLVYGRANEIFHRNPKADFLVCGDFNDGPDDPAVRDHLRTANPDAVRGASELHFFNLMAGKDPKNFGTHYYSGKPLIYDQICIGPGLLDNEGWTCEVDSIQSVTDGLIRPGSTHRQPWRFGNRRDTGARGYSDHFPVTVKLRVNSP